MQQKQVLWVGTVEASVVGTAKKGAKGVAGTRATGMAGAGIPTPAATLGPSKVSTSKEVNLAEKKKRHILIKLGSGEALSSSSESEILFFRIRASSRSSRMSSDPFEDKSVSEPRIVKLGMEEGVTTREVPPFAAWEITAKGSLVEITSSKTEGAVLV